VKSFEPVSLMLNGVQALLVHPGLGAKNFGEFMQLAKAKGKALDFATAGPGTSSRFTMELFKQTTGIESTAIHYKGGGALVPALLSGQVGVTIMTAGVAMPHIRSGKLQALAVTSAKRNRMLPEVPTISETYAGFEAQSWLGLLAPAGTPRPIVDRLNGAMSKALAAPDVKAKFEDLGYDVIGGPADSFAAWIRNESAKWSKLIKQRNIKLEQ
jgi:tripartite-type tricarboxylate transporter receptor subunit TctC